MDPGALAAGLRVPRAGALQQQQKPHPNTLHSEEACAGQLEKSLHASRAQYKKIIEVKLYIFLKDENKKVLQNLDFKKSLEFKAFSPSSRLALSDIQYMEK